MADVLDEKQREISARLNELRSLVDDYQRLEAAARVLEGVAAEDPGQARRGSTRGAGRLARGRGDHAAKDGRGWHARQAG